MFRSCRSLCTRKHFASMLSVMLYSRLISLTLPFKKPAILLISYPRSGSSWIGKILSLSPDVAYLREPVNQCYQNKFKANPVIDPESDAKVLKWYTRFADRAFAGRFPTNVPDVVENIDDFSLLQRHNKTLLLKEVNPLATDFFVRQYSPRVVLILRHPAAVADSFERMGWRDQTFEEFAYHYGTQMAQAIEASKKGWSMVVFYEDLANDPIARYATLFSSLGIRKPAQFEKVLAEFCESQNYQGHPYGIRRSSRIEANKWRTNLTRTQIDAVMKGYFRSSLKYYRAETAWTQQDKCS
jgi:sulfotransferase family protein